MASPIVQSFIRPERLFKVNLQLLDDSIRADPTNRNAIDDVAAIVSQGGNASPEMVDALQKSLSDGTASAITHMLLANNLLQRQKSSEAIPHLEMALRRAPNHPVVLNNLAFALLQEEQQSYHP